MKSVDLISIFLRLALSASFLSAVAARFNLWGNRESVSQAWSGFLNYTAQVNRFLPAGWIPVIAIMATCLETIFGFQLLIGFKTVYAAYGSGFLLLLFALAMALSQGIKEPLDYSVFTASAGAFLLATSPSFSLSIDQFLNR